MTETPANMTYARVVSRETVWFTLVIDALNSLEVKCRDLVNTYTTASIEERFWTTLGPEFRDDAGKRALIVRALYSLKSSGAYFWYHLGCCMQGLGYEPCPGDLDLWTKAEVRPDDKYEYYSHILCYVYRIMVIRHDS